MKEKKNWNKPEDVVAKKKLRRVRSKQAVRGVNHFSRVRRDGGGAREEVEEEAGG